MSERIVAFFVAALLLSITYIPANAQAGTQPKLFVIWDARGKLGYIDATGKVVIEPQFDAAYPFTEGLAAVRLGNKAGFIDASGKLVVPLKYHTTSPFSDGVASVSVAEGSGKDQRISCGYIDHSDKYVIQPQTKFNCSEAFHEGFAVAEIYDEAVGESLDTYINKQGQQAIASSLAVAKPFSEGLALIEDFSKWFFVNKEGQTLIDLRREDRANPLADEYEPAGSFSEGLALVGITVSGSAGYSRYAFMNRTGRMVFRLPAHITPGSDFHNGRAQVYVALSQRVRYTLDGESGWDDEDVSARGYIDATGRLVIKPRFSRAEDFSEGLAVVKVGKGLPIDDYNITPERWAEAYADNEAKHYSCIDRSGVTVIATCGDPISDDEQVTRFPYGESFGKGFVDGLYFSKTNAGGKTVYGYQNKSGKYVWIQPHGNGVVQPKWWREKS